MDNLKKIFTAILGSKFALWVIYPMVLLAFWLFLSVFFNPYSSFSTIVSGQSKFDEITGSSSELLAGQKIKGQFKAVDNYLGIVVFDFNTFNRTNTSSIIFRLKEKGSSVWTVNNRYKVDRFQTGRLYPFGFPVIPDSGGKIYDFEIVSLDGTKGNAVSVNSGFPFILKKYVIPYAEYRSNTNVFLKFLLIKVINSIIYVYFAPISFIYMLPFLTYVGFLISLHVISLAWPRFMQTLINEIVRRRYYMIPLLYFFMLINVFFVEGTIDLINFEIIILWLLISLYYRLSSSVHFFTAFILFLLIPPLLIFNNIPSANKIAIQVYFVLISGVLVSWYEVLKNPRLVSVNLFLKRLILGENDT